VDINDVVRTAGNLVRHQIRHANVGRPRGRGSTAGEPRSLIR
jgi:hypothetical protein